MIDLLNVEGKVPEWLAYIGVLQLILGCLMKWKRKKAIKSELSKIIEESATNVLEDIDALIGSVYMCFGAISIGLVVPPLNYKKKAKELALNVEMGYKKLEKDMRVFVRYIQAHKESFKQITSEEEWILLESVIHAFENERPDWKFLITHKSFQDHIMNDKNGLKFISALNKHLSPIDRDINIDLFQAHQRASDLAKEYLNYCRRQEALKGKKTLKTRITHHYRRGNNRIA